MRIIHTADWHIGKRLYKTDLLDDIGLYIKWLLTYIEDRNGTEQQIDALLISGDIFDLANPSSEARTIYYDVLSKLFSLNCQVIVTGGNHDSPSVLNAPNELLNKMGIRVIGKLPSKLDELLIPIYDSNKSIQCLIAAVPFLRENDLRAFDVNSNATSKEQERKNNTAKIFHEIGALAKIKYPKIPCIAMGHLHAQGVSTSESERDLLIGNLEAVDETAFGDDFAYVALGHIHKPQNVGKSDRIKYSGSPIALSFSEKMDNKRMLIININNEIVNIESVPIPKKRDLLFIKGDIQRIQNKLGNINVDEANLNTLIEIELEVEHLSSKHILDLNRVVEEFEHPNAKIIKHRIPSKNSTSALGDFVNKDQYIDELKPVEVFQKKMDEEEVINDEERSMLINAFMEVYDEVNQSEL